MTQAKIPMKDLVAQWRSLQPEAGAALGAFMEGGQYILGPAVERFEKECAAYLGASHAVGVGSGTDALLIALRALGIGAGDEVITTPFTFVASADVIVRLGATPVLADVDPATLNLAPAAVARAVTPRTKALVVVHLYGVPADLEAIRAAAPGVALIEDTAQAMGAALGARKAGSVGVAGCFSFFPTKNLGAYGDGGLIATGDDELAARARRLRVHGAAVKNEPLEIGYKSRLDALQATLLSIKLKRLDGWSDLLRRHVAQYREALADVDAVTLLAEPPGVTPAYHQFTIRAAMREDLRKYLADRGIATAIYYQTCVHLTPAFASLGRGEGSFPEAEKATREVVSLPLWPEMTAAQVDAVATAVNDFYAI